MKTNDMPTPKADKLFEDYANAPDPNVKAYLHMFRALAGDLEVENARLRDALTVVMKDIDALGHWIPTPCRELAASALANI